MSHSHRQRSTIAHEISGARLPGTAVAIATSLLLTVSACAPDQNAGSTPQDGPTSSVSESASSNAEPSESFENGVDGDEDADGEAESAPRDDLKEAPGETSAESKENEVSPARPESLEIPAIGAGSELLHLGLQENGSLEVPPGDPGSPASWYTGSPVPGKQGPAVLLGHVNDSLGQPGVFADLPDLVDGDEITVNQEDGETASFVVTRTEQYDQDTFPTLEVYGNTDDSELRLITCDGYNEATGEFEDNYVVYAALAE